MSAAEYLAWERDQRDRHQRLDGRVYAMAGGSPRHSRLAARLIALLERASAAGCQPFSSDLKVRIPPQDDFVYPDATVICGPVELHPDTTDVVQNPRVVLEVLSKSTEAHDRGEKWLGYQRLPSLTDYVLVSQREPRIEHFTRGEDGAWAYRIAGPGTRVRLGTGAELEVDAVYDGAFAVPGDED